MNILFENNKIIKNKKKRWLQSVLDFLVAQAQNDSVKDDTPYEEQILQNERESNKYSANIDVKYILILNTFIRNVMQVA